MSLLSSETSAPKESQKETLVLTKSKLAAVLALQEVNNKIFGIMDGGVLLESIPKEPTKNKEHSDSYFENEKLQRMRKRERAKRVLGLILGEVALAISDDKVNGLIERYNSAQSKKRDKCIQYILSEDTDQLKHELDSLYQQFQERRRDGNQGNELRWNIDEIVSAISADFDPENVAIHRLLLPSLSDPVRDLVLETPSLQQNTVLLSSADRSGTYFVPEFGQFVNVLLEANEIEIEGIRIPLNTALEGVPIEQIYGAESSEAVDTDRIEIFKKIAEQKLVALTHITWNDHRLLQIIKSKHFGLQGNPNRTFVEVFNFSDLPGEEVTEYLFEDRDWPEPDYINNKVFKRLSSLDIEADKYSNIGASSSKHIPRYLPSAYIHNGSTAPIFIFDAMKMKGSLYPERYFALKRLPLSHEGLRCIIVTPHFRNVLLEWIGSWSEEQRREIFGDKDIAKLIVDNAEDIS